MKDRTDNKNNNGASCLARLYWMLIGNAILAILVASLFHNKPEFPSPVDVVYLLTVASLVLVRHIDIRHLNGETGFNTPATMDHWRKYSTFLVIGSLGVWLVIRFVVPLFM